MAFGNKAKPSKIYSYKCKSPRLNAEMVRNQMAQAFDYRRQLVVAEIERRLATDRAVRRHFPLLDQHLHREQELAEEIEQLRATIKARNAASRKRQKSSPEHDRIRELVTELKLVRAHLKEQREAIWQSIGAAAKLLKENRSGTKRHWNEDMVHRAKESLSRTSLSPSGLALACEMLDIDLADNGRRRQLRANCGLYWGTYLTVEATVKRAGRPPKQHRWTGDGKLAVQIQSTKPLSTVEVFGGADSRVQIDPLPAGTFADKGRRASRPRLRVRLRIGTTEDGRRPIFCDTLMTLHRPLPPGQIQWVYLIRRRHGFHDAWQLQFVVARDEPWVKVGNATTGVVGIDVGWRLLPNGDLRVAYWAGDDGQEGQLVIPAYRLMDDGCDRKIQTWAKITDLQSVTDNHRDLILANLRKWLATNPTLPEWWTVRAEHVTQWRSVYRIYNLCIYWMENRFPGDQEIMLAVRVFQGRSRHLINWKRNQEAGLVRWRTEHYRRFVAILRRHYHTAVIEDCNFRQLQAVAEAENVDERSRLKLWRVAAVGELHRLIKEAFAQTEEVKAAGTTSRHNACGSEGDTPEVKALMHRCSACGLEYDQDENAAHNLRDAIASGAEIAKTP